MRAKQQSRWIQSTKWISAFGISAWLVFSSAHGEDVPPAFERGDGESAAATEHDLYDPFDPITDAPKLIRVQVEHIDLPHKELTRLLMQDKSTTADATALRMAVQKLADEDIAKVIDTQIVVGKSGQKSTVDSHLEFIYPTEYNPPGSDHNLVDSAAMIPSFPHNPATPVAFETRNLGSSLESEPTLGPDEKLIALRFISEIDSYSGNTVWSENKDAKGNFIKVAMPNFYVMRTNTGIDCIVGQYVLAAVVSPKNADGQLDPERKVMVFVKCDILPVVQ